MSPANKLLSPNGKPMLSARIAAKRLSCAPDYVGRLCREGRLEGVRHQGQWFVDPTSIARFESERDAARAARAESLATERREENRAYVYANKTPAGKIADRLGRCFGAVAAVSAAVAIAPKSSGSWYYRLGRKTVLVVLALFFAFTAPLGAYLQRTFYAPAPLPPQTIVVVAPTSTLPAIIDKVSYAVTERVVERVVVEPGNFVTYEFLNDQVERIYDRISEHGGGSDLSGFDCSGFGNGGKLTTDSSGNLQCDDDANTGNPGGSDTQVQFNDAGSFGGDGGFTYNKTDDRLTVSYASTTALSVNGTASTADLVISSVISSLLKTNASGLVSAAVAGTDYVTPDQIFAYPFPSNATTTLLAFNGGLTSASTTLTGPFVFGNATGTNATTTNLSTTLASTTNLIISGISNGSTQCLQVNSSGTVSGTGTACGSGTGTIGQIGPAGQLQSGTIITFATSTNGSDFTITASGDTITFNLPIASAANTGKLTATDWNIFNNKISSTSLDTSAELASLITDETGTGALVFATAPALINATLASTTLTGNSVLQNATTSTFAITSIASALLKTTTGGSVVAANPGADYVTPDQIFSYLFPNNATSTTITFEGGLVSVGSSTVNGNLVIVGNSTTTQATTTALAITGITSSLLKTNSLGSVVPAVLGTDYQNFGYPFPSNATTTLLAFNGGLTSASTTLTGPFVFGSATGTNATTTALAVTGSTTIGSVLNVGGTINANGALTVLGATSLATLTATQATTTNATSTNSLFGGRVTGNTAAFGGTASTTISSAGALSTPSLTIDSLSGLLAGNTGAVYSTATGTVSSGAGISVTAGQYIVGSGLTITNTGVTSIAATSPLSVDAATGAVTVSIQDAAADGTTKGAATFTAADFNSAAGLISIDYTNGQAASASTKGFLTSTDWSTFNNKISSTSIDTSAELAALITDETGSGALVFGTNASLTGTTLASTTLTGNFVFNTATGTQATTTALAITGITSSLLKTNSLGSVVPAVLGTDYQNFGYPFPSNATTTLLAFNGGLTTTNATSTNATSTNSLFGGRVTGNTAAFGGTASTTISSTGAIVAPSTLNIAGIITSTATAANVLPYASTTALSVSGTSYVGTVASGLWNGTAITDAFVADAITVSGGTIGSNSISGTLTTTGTLTIGDGGDRIDIDSDTWDVTNGAVSGVTTLTTSGLATLAGFLSTASSTVNGNLVIVGNSTTTQATTTALAITGITSSLLKTNSLGSVVPAVLGTDYQNFGYPFPSNATSTLLTFSGGILSTASSTIGNGTATGGLTVSGTATTTNLRVTSLTSGRVPYVTTGSQFTDSSNLTFDGTTLAVTGGLSVSGTVSLGDGTPTVTIDASNWDVTAGGEGVFVSLTTVNNVTSGGDILTSGAGDDFWLGNSTQSSASFQAYAAGNLMALASSTIGGGTAGSGLTVSGGATTTGSQFILGTASTTNLTVSGLGAGAGNCLTPNSSGVISTQTCSNFAYPFPSNATTTQIAFNGGLTAVGATTTALAVTGSTTISTVLNVGGAVNLATALTVPSGGTGATSLTDGGVLLGSGTGAITAMAVLGNGAIIVGDGTTDPVALTAFTSSTGDLIHEAGGLEADVSGYTNGLYGQLAGVTADIDTESELETALGSLDVVTVTAGDITSANLITILSDETGTGSAVFGTNASLTGTTLASTTLTGNFVFNTATGTQATTTNFAISSISAGSLLKATTGGAVIAAVLGTDYQNFGYPFPSNATTTLLAFNGGLTTTNATSTNATSTNSLFGGRVTGNTAAFGGTASTTISSAGALLVGGSLTATDSFSLGDNGDVGIINTSDWDISIAGAISNATYEGLTITSTTGTLTVTNGKTLSVSNSLTFAGTDSTTITFQGTDTYVGRTTTDTLTNKTLSSFSISSGATATTLGTFTLGDNGDAIVIDASNWDVSSAGAATFTALTVSGATSLATLTATQATTTNATSTNSLFGGRVTGNTAAFGGTASTTISSAGAIVAPSTLNIAGIITSTATAANVLPYASTTALTVSGTGYFGTASTTNLTISSLGAGAGNCLTPNSSGVISTQTCANFSYPFPSNATTTLLAFNGGLTTTNATSTNATSTNSLFGGRVTGNTAAFGGTATTSISSAGAFTSAATSTNTFPYASSTALTATNLFSTLASTTNSLFGSRVTGTTAAFGGSASTTISSAGVITSAATSSNVLPYASTTALTVSGSFYGAGLSTCSSATDKLLWDAGVFSCGIDLNTGGGGASGFSFTTYYGVLTAATSSAIWAQGGLFASSTSHFANADFVAATSTSLFGTTLSTNVARFGQTATTTIDAAGQVGIGTSSPSAKLAVAGGNIYQAASGNPTLAAATTTGSRVYATAVSGRLAYLAEYGSGLRIVDISNPRSPKTVGTVGSLGNALSVAVAGKYAYVGTESSVHVIDVSKPSTPVVLSTYSSLDFAYNIALSGRYLFVTDDSNGLRILDVSNPASPTLAGTYSVAGNLYALAVAGRYAYVGDQGNGDTYIVDISNPATPALVGTYTAGTAPAAYYVSGKYLYVGDSGGGVYILDVSNPSSPTLAGTYDGSGVYYGVQVAGSYAYVTDNGANAVRVLDVSDPASPVLIGSYTTASTPWGVTLAGKYAYVADNTSGLKILDINGATFPAAHIGALESNMVNVSDDLTVGNNITAGGSLNVGISGIFSRGTISAYIASSTQTNPVVASFMGGNVGIGTSSPSYHLDVSGFVNVDGYSGYKQAGNTILYASSSLASIGVGENALNLSFTGVGNTALGYSTLTSLTSGSNNTAAGRTALDSNTTGGQNSAFGVNALTANSIGGSNSAFGYNALSSNTASQNAAFGTDALTANTSGNENSAFGYRALFLNTTGVQSTAVGNSALVSALGSHNVGVGYQAGTSITTGYGNVLIGASPTANNLTTGGGNIGIGTNIFFESATGNKQLNIGGLIFGTLPATSTAFILPTSGSIGIGTSSPFAKLSIHSNNGDTATTLFAIASSTSSATTTHFVVNNIGNVGLGTTNPYGRLAISSANLSQTWSKVGTELSTTTVGNPALAALSPTRVAFIDDTNDALTAYDWNGSTWVQVGSSFAISNVLVPSITALSPNQIAFFDSTNDSLRVYEFDGTSWSQVGTGKNISTTGVSAVAALSPNRIAYIDATNDSLRAYDFDGSTWVQVGVGVSTTTSSVEIAALSPNRVALLNSSNATLQTYEFNGSTWITVGSGFRITGLSTGVVTSLSPDRVAITDSNDVLHTYSFNGSNWSEIGTGSSVPPFSVSSALAALSPNRVALIDDTNEALTTYQFSTPLIYAAGITDLPYFAVSDVGYTTAEAVGIRTTLTVGQAATSTASTTPLVGTSTPALVVNGNALFQGGVGIGTSTPWAQLAINPNINTSIPSLLVGSSTRTDFIVTQAGNVGVGTSTPGSLFAIQGIANFQTGTSTLYNNLNVQGQLKVGTGSIFLNGAATSTFSAAIQSTCFSTDGSTCLSSGGGSNFSYPFPSNATTTQIGFNGGLTTTNATSTNATSTNSLFGGRVTGNTAAFGGTASTTISSAGAIVAPSTLNIAGIITSTATGANTLPYASSTALTVSGTTYLGAATITSAGAVSGVTTLGLSGVITSTATGANVLPYASSTALTVSGSAYLGTTGSQNVGVGATTTPWAKFTVDTSSLAASVPSFAVGSSTRTDLVVTQAGTVGVNVASPSSAVKFQVGDSTAQALARFTTDASDIYIGRNNTTAFGISAGNTAFIIQDSSKSFPLAVGTIGSQPLILGTAAIERMRIAATGYVGIGTTTPFSTFSIQPGEIIGNGLDDDGDSSNGETEVVFSIGSSIGPLFSFTNTGGFMLGTTSMDKFLNTTLDGGRIYAAGRSINVENPADASILLADSNAGANLKTFQLVNSSGVTTLRSLTDTLGGVQATFMSLNNSTGAITLNTGITQSATGDVLCFSASNEMTRDTTPGSGVCGNSASDARLKTNVAALSGALEKIKQLRPSSFDWRNPSQHDYATSTTGFIAQQLAEVLPELVGEDTCRGLDCALVADGNVKTISVTGPEFQAYLVSAIQELNLNLETIASTTASSTPQSQSFAAAFWDNLKEQVGEWLADAGNGLASLFAETVTANVINTDTVNTQELCIDGLCITKEELQDLLNGSGSSGSWGGGGSTPPPQEPPAEEPPADEPPAETPPADEPPAEEPPAGEAPTQEPPAEEPPADEPPAETPPADEPPADEPPAEQP